MPVITGSGETRVNTINAGDQSDPYIMTLRDGGWIVTWTSGTGGNLDIHQQRFNALGQAVGQETRVNTTSQDVQFYGSVTALHDGGWVVVWSSEGQDGSGQGIYQQRYDVYGRKIGPERLVNTHTDLNQMAPEVTALEDGGWVITWHGNNPSGQGWDIYQQRYDARGYERGGETRVNTVLAGSQGYTSITALKDGGWLVTWNGEGGQDGDLGGVYQQRFDASGSKLGSEIRVNTYWAGDQFWGKATALADGGWIVTWTSEGQDGSGRGVYQQQYNADGWSVDGEIRINASTSGHQQDSNIVGLADGGWVVTWAYNDGQNPDSAAIYQKRYAANGQAVTGEIKVNATGGIAHGQPFIAALPDGGWVVSWRAVHDGEIGIYQQRFTANGTKLGPTTPTDLTLSAQPVKEGASAPPSSELSLPRRSSRRASPIRS